MSLRDTMAADLLANQLNTEDLADNVTVTLPGGASFAAVALFGDPDPARVEREGATQNRQISQAIMLLAAVRAGCEDHEGEERDLELGDTITVASGPHKGTWAVEYSTASTTGSLTVQIVKSFLESASGMREVGA